MILGNGIAGQTCAEELRLQDPECSIVMIAAERHPLYNRVALPRYLRGQVREEKVLMRTVDDYAARNLVIHFETWATRIDPVAKVVSTDRAGDFSYDAVLVATRVQPSPAPGPGAAERSCIYGFQTLTAPHTTLQTPLSICILLQSVQKGYLFLTMPYCWQKITTSLIKI